MPTAGALPPPVLLVGTGLAAALIAVVALGYDSRLFAPFYLVRVAPLLPLSLAAAAAAVVAARGRPEALRADFADVAALAFAVWQLVAAAVSPAPSVALFGYYNRGAGAFFWLSLAVAFVAFRRLLDGERQRRILVWTVATVDVVASLVALAQLLGASSFWGGSGSVDRLTGTTGNATHLGGLGLLAVWLAAGLTAWRTYSATWIAALTGTAAGLVCVVLSVSRAAMLALLVCAVVAVLQAALRRRRRALVLLGGLVVLVVVVAAAYAAGPGDSVLGRIRSAGGGLTGSDDRRVELWREAGKAVIQRPLVGVGPGAFVVADRLFRPAESLVAQPWQVASDPHSLPLLVASTSGIAGLLLGGLCVVAALLALLRRVRRREAPDGDDDTAAEPEPGPEVRVAAAAALFAVLAAAVFLLVSPLDAVVIVPLIVVVSAGSGHPRAGAALTWELIWLTAPSARRIAGVVSLVVIAAAFLVSVWAAATWYGADLSFARFARGGDVGHALSAADAWTFEPFYALEAGGRTWRRGLEIADEGLVDRGTALVERAFRRDPTGPLAPADLARLHIASGEPDAAATTLRRALRWHPHQPVLQGLWGYAALVAQEHLKDPESAKRLLDGLQQLPVDTPDGWFWIGRVLAARGDASGARAARARAAELAPKLGSWRYKRRLLAGR